jgi:hypothetical protein
VAGKEGKVDAVLVAALESPDAGQRAAAALVVGVHGNPEQRKAALRLLDDAQPEVRLRAAQGFLAARNKVAVPVLVALLKKAAPELAETAEGLLLDIADTSAPKVHWKNSKEDREKCFAAWLAWWHQHKDQLDLANAEINPLILGGAGLAKQVGFKFLQAVADRDAALLQRTAAVPFHWGDNRMLDTEEELIQKLVQDRAGATKEEIDKLKFSRVVPLRVFAQVVKAESKKYLETLRGGTFYAVCWDATAIIPNLEFALIVRLRGGQARVVGVASSNQ